MNVSKVNVSTIQSHAVPLYWTMTMHENFIVTTFPQFLEMFRNILKTCVNCLEIERTYVKQQGNK